MRLSGTNRAIHVCGVCLNQEQIDEISSSINKILREVKSYKKLITTKTTSNIYDSKIVQNHIEFGHERLYFKLAKVTLNEEDFNNLSNYPREVAGFLYNARDRTEYLSSDIVREKRSISLYAVAYKSIRMMSNYNFYGSVATSLLRDSGIKHIDTLDNSGSLSELVVACREAECINGVMVSNGIEYYNSWKPISKLIKNTKSIMYIKKDKRNL